MFVLNFARLFAVVYLKYTPFREFYPFSAFKSLLFSTQQLQTCKYHSNKPSEGMRVEQL